MRRRLIALALACMALLAAPGVTVAQDDDVFVDPDSPTGHEYDIPLERARRDATSKPDANTPYRSRNAPLFGEGIEPAVGSDAPSASSSGGSTSGGKSNSRRESTKHSRSKPVRRQALPSTVEAAIKQPGAPSRDGKSLLLVGVLAAGLIGLGAAAGTLARRRR